VNDAGDVLRMNLTTDVETIIGRGIFLDPTDLTISTDGLEVLIGSESNTGVYAFDVSEESLTLSNINRIANGYVPGRIRTFPSGDEAIIDETYGGVEVLGVSYLRLPNGSEPRDVDENERGVIAIANKNAASVGGPSNRGYVRIDTGSGGAVVNTTVGMNPTAIEMSRANVGELTIAPSPVLFEYSYVGQVVIEKLGIRNTGDADVSLRSIDVNSPSPFRVLSHSCPSTLRPGSGCSVRVEFVAPARSKNCTLNPLSFSCRFSGPSYSGFLDVDNDAGSRRTTGVALQAEFVFSWAPEKSLTAPLEISSR
jgi:hypothetical protein